MERAFGLEIPRTLEEACDPRRLALVVYDMQIGVLGQIKDADAIARQVMEVLDAARLAVYGWFSSGTCQCPGN
jgi:biuret amidohydrolase